MGRIDRERRKNGKDLAEEGRLQRGAGRGRDLLCIQELQPLAGEPAVVFAPPGRP